MIPYDDLVVALATWRAKKGLPVGQVARALTPTPQAAAPAAAAPSTGSGSGPKRGPPGAPPQPTRAPGSGRAAAPAPLPLPVETLDIDEHMVDEEPIEADELGHAFSNLPGDGDEATAIGSAPGPRDSFGGGGQTDPGPSPLEPKGPSRSNGNRNDDW